MNRPDKKDSPAIDRQDPIAALGQMLGGVANLSVEVTLEFGRTKITLEEARRLGQNALLSVDGAEGDPVDVRVNGELFARGKLVLVGENYGVQLTELID